MAKENKLEYVDALRGLAIMLVLVVHCAQCGTNAFPLPLQHLFAAGALGVQLFFVMSAFTLFLSYGRRLGKEQSPNRNFFVRRMFRIAPMYYLGIVYYLWQNGRGASYWTGGETGISAANIIANFFFMHGTCPYWINSLVPGGWSIATEMCFYLFVPLLFLWIKDGRHAFRAFAIMMAVRVVLELLLRRYALIGDARLWHEFLFFYLPSQMPIFLLGILMFFLVRGGPNDRRFAPLDLALFAMIAGLHVFLRHQLPFPMHILISIGFLGLALLLVRWPSRIIVNPVVRHIGKVSFSLYLVHFAVLHWFDRFGLCDPITPHDLPTSLLNLGIRYALVLGIGTLLSTLTYHLIEMPMQDAGQRLIKRLEGN